MRVRVKDVQAIAGAATSLASSHSLTAISAFGGKTVGSDLAGQVVSRLQHTAKYRIVPHIGQRDFKQGQACGISGAVFQRCSEDECATAGRIRPVDRML